MLQYDPRNEEARALLDQVGFLTGDRTHEVSQFAHELSDLERVREQVRRSDLERLYRRGLRQMENEQHKLAAATFQRILDTIRWLPTSRRLTDLETKTRSQAQKAATGMVSRGSQ